MQPHDGLNYGYIPLLQVLDSFPELISEGALAVEMGASLEDIALTIHPHPTLPETMMEAAEAALGHAIHIYQGK